MKIKNKTHWQSTQIRAIVSEVIKRSPEYLRRKYIDQKYRAKLDIEVVYNKQKDRGGCSGRGWYNSWSIKLMLPSQTVDRVDLAMVVAHELAHTLNYGHTDMEGNALFHRIGNWREIYGWAEALPLEQTPKKQKPQGADLQLVRYNRTIAGLTRWATKLKRAQTAIKKLNTQRRYYERALAAKGVKG